MKSTNLMCVTAIAVFCLLAIPVGLAAQDIQTSSHIAKHHTYKLIDLGTLGGPNSGISGPEVQIINNGGTMAGFGDTSAANPNPGCFIPFNAPDCNVENPFVWKDGALAALPVLPGGVNSQTDWISSSGLISGWSENGLIDPMTGQPEGRAVLWTKDLKIVDLGTVTGGTESLATSNNNRGQVVGFSNNDVADSFSYVGFPTQTRAFLWQNGTIQDLGTLGGPDAFPNVMNEHGQVAGLAYTNSTPNATTGLPTVDPFFWEKGTMQDLGTLGGTFGQANWMNERGQVVGSSNLAGDNASHPFLWDAKDGLKDLGNFGGNGNYGSANAINDAGDVVGWSDLPGSQAYHAFLWEHGVTTDIGAPVGQECSIAYSINSKRQVMGESTGPCNGNGETWLWENGGPPVDLDALIVPSSGLFMYDAWFINDRGEIPGTAYDPATGNIHAVVLIPQGDCDDYCEARIAANAAAKAQSSLATGAITRNRGRESAHANSNRYRFHGFGVQPQK